MNIWDMKGSVGQRGYGQPGPLIGTKPGYETGEDGFGSLFGGQQYSIPGEEEDEEPKQKWKIGDPSGFVEAGMTPPPLPNPMTEMMNLMSMAMKQAPQQQAPPSATGGNIMNYLRMLTGG